MYTVNVIVACQFDDTGWDYLDNPLYRYNCDSWDEAVDEFAANGHVSKDAVVEAYRRDYPECMAFELEASIYKDGELLDDWFCNERIWTKDGWDY